MDLEALRASLPKGRSELIKDALLVRDDSYSWLLDGSVDLVLTDPPFNIARDTNFHTYEKNTINSFRFDADKGWDTYSPADFRELLSQWAKEFARVLRSGGSFAVFCADEYLSDLIGALRAAGLKPRRTLTWRKPNAVPVNRRHMMMSACEYVVVGVKGSNAVFNADIKANEEPLLTDREIIQIADKASVVMEMEIRKALSGLTERPEPKEIKEIVAQTILKQSGVVAKRAINIYSEDGLTAELCVPNYVSFNSKAGGRLHPTEKPVPLLRYLTELLSSEGDLILDPFSGSASTGEAALTCGRKVVLVERDEDFFKKGRTRLKALVSKVETQEQVKLF